MKPAATLITHFATVDLAAKAWPEALEMPGKATKSMKCKKTLGGRGFVPDPARGAYSSPQTSYRLLVKMRLAVI